MIAGFLRNRSIRPSDDYDSRLFTIGACSAELGIVTGRDSEYKNKILGWQNLRGVLRCWVMNGSSTAQGQ